MSNQEIILSDEQIQIYQQLSKSEQELVQEELRAFLLMRANRRAGLQSIRDHALDEVEYIRQLTINDPPEVRKLLEGIVQRDILKHADEVEDVISAINRDIADNIKSKSADTYSRRPQIKDYPSTTSGRDSSTSFDSIGKLIARIICIILPLYVLWVVLTGRPGDNSVVQYACMLPLVIIVAVFAFLRIK